MDVPVAQPSPSWSRSDAWWLLLLTVLGLGLRLSRLGNQSLWIDEGMSLGWIQEIERSGPGVVLKDIHGPLHALALYAVSRVSTSEWWLRLPSVVAATLAIPALAQVGRRLWGRKVGLTAAALCVVSPFALYYAQEVRNYAFTFLFASVMTLAALDFARRPGVFTSARFVFAEILAIASNLNGLFFALGLQIWLLGPLRRSRHGVRLWVAAQVLLAGCLLPYALEVRQQVRPERLVGVQTPIDAGAPLRGETTLHPLSLPYAGYAFAVGYSLGPTLAELRRDPSSAASPRDWPILGLALFGFGLPLLTGMTRRASWPAAMVLALPSLVVVGMTLWLAAANVKPFNVRYLSVLQPAYLLVVAQGIWLLRRRLRLLVLATIAVGSLWSCFNYLFVPRYGRDDTRGVVEYLQQHAAPEDLVLQINLGFTLRYYDRLSQEILLAAPGSGSSPEAAERYLDGIVPGHSTLWYLECRPEGLDPRGYLRNACLGRAVATETRDFVGIRVYRFDLAPPEAHSEGS